MILKNLRLINFRKFPDSIIELPDGVTAVIGLNGVGKSTIFEAIAWVLYGPVAARTSSDQIKRDDAQVSEPCRVELDFIFDENTYRIIREMTGKNLVASATALFNGKEAASGVDQVTKFIQQQLGMDFKSFYTSIFAKQKELNALSSMNPSERRPLILRMLGIDQIDDVLVEIRSDLRTKQAVIDKLESDLVNEHGVKRLDIYKQDLNKLMELQHDIKDIVEKDKNNILALEQKHDNIKKVMEENKKEYENQLFEKQKLDEIKTSVDKRKHLEKEFEELQKKIHQRKELVSNHKTQLKKYNNLSEEIKRFQKTVEDNTKKVEGLIQIRQEQKTIINQLRKEIEDIETKEEKIKKLGPEAKCPTCDRVLQEQYDYLVKQYSLDIADKEKKIHTHQLAGEKTEANYTRVIREKQALQKKQFYLQKQQLDHQRIQTTMTAANNELKQEEKKLEQLTKKLKESKILTYDEKQHSLLKKTVQESYTTYQRSIGEYQKIQRKLEQARVQKVQNEGEQKLVVEQISSCKNKIKEQELNLKRVEQEKKHVQSLKMTYEVMGSFRTYLISQIRPTLAIYASQMFEQLTDGKYSTLELDEDYNIVLYDNGVAYTIDRFSGGEEDLANLCIRLAISEVITERAGSLFQFIVLDEIFGSQDMLRRQNILRSLHALSSKFRQIFLITHIEDIKQYTENVLTVIENERGMSSVKLE